jgi:cullin 3
MVLHKHGDRLYNGVIDTLSRHLKSISSRVAAAQGETFLKELKNRWDEHVKSTQMIRDILMVRATCSPAHCRTCRHGSSKA